MQTITVKENKKTFRVQMPENFDRGSIFIEPTPASVDELSRIKEKVKDALKMMMDVIANPDESSDNKLLTIIAVKNFIERFRSAGCDESNDDHTSITFIQSNNVELLIHQPVKYEDDTYGTFVAATLTMMLSPKGADLDAPCAWHVRYTKYTPAYTKCQPDTQEYSIGDDFEEGEDTVNTIKGLVSSICTLGKA